MKLIWHRLRDLFVILFVGLNIIMIVLGALPDRSAVGDKIFYSIAARYQDFFALYQSWSMFAPNPSNENSYIDAELAFSDGSKEKWTFPRARLMSPMDRITSGERFRKFAQDNLIPMEKEDVWIDFGRFITREVEKVELNGKHRKLERVEIFRHANYVQVPSKVFVPHGTMSTQYSSELVFHYKPEAQVKYEARNNN